MGLTLSLTITEGPEKGKSFEFEAGTYTVGRASGDIRLADKKVSGKHCQFIVDEKGVWIEDLNSTNGTFLGSRKIETKTELSNLDVVTIGLSRFSVAIVEGLEDFKKVNTPVSEPQNMQDQATKRSETPADLPPEDAVYRETGVQRIEGLIEDELKSFSKWDHPAAADPSDPKHSIPKIRVVLVARKAPEGVTQITCTDAETSLGRKGVDVRLNDLDLSRKHCSIEIIAGNRPFVRDLASTNGTYVNGKKISYQELKEGDLLQIGQCIFEVRVQEKA